MAKAKSTLKGFTMIELLVVVAIMAVLIAITVSTFSNFQKSGRDSKRRADLGVFQSTLQQYHADLGFYPATFDLPTTTSITDCTGRTGCSSPTRTYLNSVPKDPSSTTTPYRYTSSSPTGSACDNGATKCARYCLLAQVEKTSNASNLTACTDPVSPYDPTLLYELISP